MNDNLNLVEILKDCPEGTILYSPIFGDVEFLGVSQYEDTKYPIEVKLSDNAFDSFTKDGRIFTDYSGECLLFPSQEERDWSKFNPNKHKFDPKTLKPFDKVLVRDSDENWWRCALFSHKRENDNFTYYVTTDTIYKYCIPYNNDTKHLVGTTEEAPEYYRYWED